MTTDATAQHKFSPTFVVGLLVVLIVGWWAATRLTTANEKGEARDPAPIANAEEAALRTVGLRYNADWVGLPEYFKAVTEEARWQGNRALFAYWNPGSNAYDYFFQVTRNGQEFRFEEITLQEAIGVRHRERDLEVLRLEESAGGNPVSRETRFPHHPFALLPLSEANDSTSAIERIEMPQSQPAPASRLPVELPSVPTELPVLAAPVIEQQSPK